MDAGIILSCSTCLQYAAIVTNQSFAGHLGADELAAAAISVTVRRLFLIATVVHPTQLFLVSCAV